jgi:hypothetical protein
MNVWLCGDRSKNRGTNRRIRPAVSGCLAAVTALCVSSVAQAVVVSGAFAGMASVIDHFPNPSGSPTSDDTPVTGSFTFDVGTWEDLSTGQGPSNGGLAVGAATVSLTYASGFSGTFGGSMAMTSLTLADTPEGQRMTWSTTSGLYDSFSLNFAGPSGAFVEGADLTTVHAGPIDLSRSSATFGGHWTQGRLSFTDLRFDPVTAPVPEPGTWLLMLGGVGFVLRRSAKRTLRPHAAAAA